MLRDRPENAEWQRILLGHETLDVLRIIQKLPWSGVSLILFAWRKTLHTYPKAEADKNGVFENNLWDVADYTQLCKEHHCKLSQWQWRLIWTGRKGAVIAFIVNEGPKSETQSPWKQWGLITFGFTLLAAVVASNLSFKQRLQRALSSGRSLEAGCLNKQKSHAMLKEPDDL